MTKQKLSCAHCSKEFVPTRINNTHYCSRKCSKAYQVKKYKLSIRKTCPYCQRLIDGRSTKCRNCAPETEKIKKMTLLEYQEKESVKGRHASWINSHVRNFTRSWNRDLQKLPCQKCGYSRHVELCHVKAVQSFDKSTLLGIVNDPSNLVVLCPNCHWEFDNGYLSIEDIPPRT